MDWVRFLEENNVHYVTRGPNTKRGEISIKCPFCGPADPSEHLGIDLVSGKWGCHRDVSHRGTAAARLVRATLNCSSSIANKVISQYGHPDPDELDAALISLEKDNSLLPVEESERTVSEKELKAQFAKFHKIKPRGVTKRFFRYLQNRGYNNPQDLCKRYDLRCANVGRYSDRIIIPVYHDSGLLGWTSRAIIDPVSAPRYLASSGDIKTTVLNYDELKKGGDRLFIVEGPFDAIRMNGHTSPHNDISIRATCTFGTSVTVAQCALLRRLSKEFNETYVLFDEGADGPAQNLAEWAGVKVAYLPFGVKDPGLLREIQLDQACAVNFHGRFISLKLTFPRGIFSNAPTS